ncbi:hypothetical protein Zmor_018869 [Zophobas morio]|uniref:Pyruvate kinase n=1 Tax=Zophobas morio TaxID=2755281 RepID=A0AA38IEX3_9CUCU|nr:hypothetical protein Zmor_018869 [Zophobas morio]
MVFTSSEIETCRVTEIILYQDDIIELSADETYVIMSNNPKVIHINYNNFHRVVKVGNKVNINRRTIHLVCTDIVGAVVVCKVLKGGTVLSGSRVHLPGIPVDMPALNDIDKRVLTFAVESGIDIIFAAYVRDETTVNEIRQFLGPAGKHIMICSEIENLQGIVNIDEIIKASDAIMVARLDLANEIADEKVFLAQRSIISKCNVVGKPVVCTTHLLESMMYSRIPSRSESTDIANAIMNGVDCVMLYHETALGDYPVATVKQAVAMCKQAEPAIWQKRMVMDLSKKIQAPIITTHALAAAAVEISFSSLASAIVITTASMKSAHLLSKYRPKCPIIAVTRNENQARQAHMFRGIIPLLYKDQREIDWKKDLEKRVYFGINFGRKRGFIRPGEPVVIVTSSVQGSGFADKMRIVYVTKHISHGTECIC